MKNSDRQNRLNQQFVADSRIVFDVPLGGKILRGNIVLTGSVVLATTAEGTQLEMGGPTRLISRVRVKANPAAGSRYPGGTIVDCYPSSLLRWAMVERAGFVLGEQSGSVLGNGASGTYPIYLSIPIYFADANLRRQVQTALNADPTAYQSIQVEVDTADITNCFTGWTGTANYSGLSVQWVDDRENFAGDTLVRFQEDHDYLIAATGKRFLDKAMPQDGAFESWTIMALQSAQQNLSDGLFVKLLLNGDAIDYEKYAQDIRQQMIDDEWIDPQQTATGLYFTDFTDGLVGGTINAQTLQFNFDANNVSGANLDTIRFYTRRLASPQNYAAAGGPSAAQNG